MRPAAGFDDVDIDLAPMDLLDDIDLPLPARREGKIRIGWNLPADRLLFVTTDRLSAFDRVLGCVPGKGQVLNRLAWWWFDELGDIVANHALSLPDPNVLVARRASPLPVEVIVRGAITGVTTTSLWMRYRDGQRSIDGHRLPDGLRKNELLAEPIITPTTKAAAGGHDEPLSVSAVVARGLVEETLWSDVCDASLALFARGAEVARAAGLVLADTKYEFGIDADGQLLLIDEVHTPDSSRFWNVSTYEDRLSAGAEPESFDKEIIRRAYADRGYRGDGTPPVLPSGVWDDVALAYRTVFERLTGEPLVLTQEPVAQRIVRALTSTGLIGN